MKEGRKERNKERKVGRHEEKNDVHFLGEQNASYFYTVKPISEVRSLSPRH